MVNSQQPVSELKIENYPSGWLTKPSTLNTKQSGYAILLRNSAQVMAVAMATLSDSEVTHPSG